MIAGTTEQFELDAKDELADIASAYNDINAALLEARRLRAQVENDNRQLQTDIVALLESGKSVITTTSYNHLPTFGSDVHDRIRTACERGGTRFHAAGEHPGFMFERLATSVTAGMMGAEPTSVAPIGAPTLGNDVTVEETVHG